MKSLRWVPILSLPCLALVAAGCAETTQTTAPGVGLTVIRVGSPFKPGHILVDVAEKFTGEVAKRSGGRIEVQLDAGTKTEIDINKMNSVGALEMQANGTAFLEYCAPPYYFFTGP